MTELRNDLDRLTRLAFDHGLMAGRRESLIDLRGTVAASFTVGVIVGVIVGLVLTGWI